MTLCIEEALRRAEHRAAFVRYAADAAVNAEEGATPEALSGLADVVAEIETIARVVRKALKVEALGIEIRVKEQ